MQCYSELIGPSGITHSVHLSFTSTDARNLIIVRTSLLQVFAVKHTGQGSDVKLVLVAEYPLPGTVTDVGRVKPLHSKIGGDALLIAFRDAKLSLIEWDAVHHSISTISIHYYENHDLLLCPWSPDPSDCVSRLTIDPSSRCAAFNFGISNVAIIPFHQAGDDLALDDLDDMNNSDVDTEESQRSLTKQTNGNGHVDEHSTPYAPSFVLPLSALDPGLLHPMDMAFLHEYRDPTIGILYSSLAHSVNMAPERRDAMIYAVYTLDLEQRASTTLLSIAKLPNDLFRVVALPAPVGGSLLIGGNEIVHVDQGGKCTGIAVNELTKDSTSFPLADISVLEIRLEGCTINGLGASSTDLLIVLRDASFMVLSFRLDGRSVSGLSLRHIDAAYTSGVCSGAVSSLTYIEPGCMFVASEQADSTLMGFDRHVSQLKRQVSRTQPNNLSEDPDANENFDFEQEEGEEEGDDDDDDDDDLYATEPANGSSYQSRSIEGANIRVLDRLPCLAPIHDLAFGKAAKRKRQEDLDEDSDDDADLGASQQETLDLVLACGRGNAGSLVFLSRELTLRCVRRIGRTRTKKVWSLSSEKFEMDSVVRAFDDMLVVSERLGLDDHQSSLLTIDGGRLEDRDAKEFETGDRTVAVGRLASNQHVVVYPREVRAYDSNFGLSQIVAVVDEEASPPAFAEVVAATVVSPYVLLLKDDFSLTLLQADKNGELDEVDLQEAFPSKNILSARLYRDTTNFFDSKKYYPQSKGQDAVLLVLLTSDGTLALHSLPDLNIQIFQHHRVQFLPTRLSPDLPTPKHWRKEEEIAEILLADLGDDVDRKPYVVVRTSSSDVVVYEPFAVGSVTGAYHFQKIASHNGGIPTSRGADENDESGRSGQSQLQPLSDFGGFSTVFVSGERPALILRKASSMPHVHSLGTGPIRHVAGFHDSSCNRGLVYISKGDEMCFAELPTDQVFGLSNWSITRVSMNEEVTGVAYYPRTSSYVLATNHPTPFHLPRDDEWHPEWEAQYEKVSDNFLPTTIQSSLKLLSSQSHSVISQYQFDPCEQIMTVRCLNLEVSEETHERKDMVVVGTSITKGENVVTRGMIYIFEIVDVIPQPDIPETDIKLKLITKEDVRGAVTSICDIGSQGFLLAAQGQKCMVRGLREDNAILPVAFMDMRYYVKVAKELKGTGLTILGDAFSGLWLMGYSEEPYKMQLLGRDLEDPACVSAEFLPQQKELYIISSDGNGVLRVLHYDPENPKTERGARLLLRSTFNSGSYITNMVLIPRTPTPSEVAALLPRRRRPANNDEDDEEEGEEEDEDAMDLDGTLLDSSDIAKNQVLVTTQEGSIALITPLSEHVYRRLSTLQNILLTQLEHPCGLNPRAYRAVETDGLGGRGMIDGDLLRRWLDQSSQHRLSAADKAGGEVWEIKSDLEAVLGGGLGFL